MKVLFICNYFQPMNYAENEISRELLALGHTVSVVTGDRYFPFPNYADTVGKTLGRRQQKTGVKRANGLKIIRNKICFEFAARAVFFGIKNSIEKIKPDIIIVFGVSAPAAVQAALFKPSSAILIYVDSHLPSELNSGNQVFKCIFYGFFKLFFASIISRKADKIIAVQEATVEVIKNTYGINRPITIISHGTNKQLFRFSKQKRSRLRKQLAIKESDFVIIYSGKIISAKGVDLLFLAFKQLSARHPRIHLLVVGDGPKEYLEKCVSYIPDKSRHRVHLVGFQPQDSLPSFYSVADVAVWPLQESLAMNDAASCGLPFIANDKIGVKERLSNRNALLYKQNNVLDLIKQIEYLYKNPRLRKEMGKRGRKLAEEKMSWEQKAREYIQ